MFSTLWLLILANFRILGHGFLATTHFLVFCARVYSDRDCGGTRCCSRWGWCGGRRDGGKPRDPWCGSKIGSTLLHVYGFAHETEDISVGLTMAFTGFLGVIGFTIFQLVKRVGSSSDQAQYESLLTDTVVCFFQWDWFFFFYFYFYDQ